MLDVPRPGPDLASQRFSGFLPIARRFRDLIDHPAVLEIVRETCGPNVRLDHVYGIVMERNTAGLGLHGGGTPFDPAQHYRADSGRIRTGLMAAQWALVDHPPGGGGFVCVPGSHKSAFPLPPTFDRELVVQVPLAAGDVVVFTEALTHGTLPWQGERAAPHAPLQVLARQLGVLPRAVAGRSCVAACTDRQRLLLQPPSVGGHRPVVP